MQKEMLVPHQAVHSLPAMPSEAPVFHWAHANGFCARTYTTLLAPLRDHAHVYAWDARGHGETELPADPAAHRNWQVYKHDLIAVLEQLVARHQKPVYIGGHSMGGTTSLMAAAERPDLVAGLLFVDPVIFPDYFMTVDKYLSRFTGKSFQDMFVKPALRRRRVFASAEAMYERYRGRGTFRSWQDAFLRDYVAYATRPVAEGLRLRCEPEWEAANFAARNRRPFDDLKKLSSPFVVLKGETGSTTRHPGAFKRHGFCLHYEEIPGSTHMLPMEFPDRVRAVVLEKLMVSA
ncbi:MAG: alpha/beta fold hydrolase [Parvibaculales bacterium]